MFSRLMQVVKLGDKRKERRVKTRFPAEVAGLKGRVTDVSLGGFGFYPDDQGLDIGDEAIATLMPDEFTTLEIPSRIVGMDEEGMILSIAFMKVTEEQFEPLQDIITSQTLG